LNNRSDKCVSITKNTINTKMYRYRQLWNHKTKYCWSSLKAKS